MASSFVFVSKKLVRASIQEVRPSAGGTIHREIEIPSAGGFFIHPVLDKLSALRTLEYDVTHGLPRLASPIKRVFRRNNEGTRARWPR